MTIALGIDPGLAGGLALVAGKPAPGRVIAVMDIPTVGLQHKRRVDVQQVLAFIQHEPPDFAVIERAQLMPGQNISAGAVYMRAVGALEACVYGLGLELKIIESTAWKKHFGLFRSDVPPGLSESKATAHFKEMNRLKARELFPTARNLDTKFDHNRAESVLIAAYGCAVLANA